MKIQTSKYTQLAITAILAYKLKRTYFGFYFTRFRNISEILLQVKFIYCVRINYFE